MFSYQKAIATAFHDVSNALIAVDKQRAYREQQEHLVAAAQDATRLARIRYQGGATGYLEVLTTDTNLFTGATEPCHRTAGRSADPGPALTARWAGAGSRATLRAKCNDALLSPYGLWTSW